MQTCVGPFCAPDRLLFGGGASETLMHPVVFVAMLMAILLILSVPRKFVIIPFLLCIFVVPRGQQLYIGGTHWYVLRILILAGLARLARAKFNVGGGLNGIDKAFALWAVV